MTISTFDMFKIGLGPSSSHTVGPMVAANLFLEKITATSVSKIEVKLYGSLALTGLGHGTDKACILGLMGLAPATTAADLADEKYLWVKANKQLAVNGEHTIDFDPDSHIQFFNDEFLPEHPNGMTLIAFDDRGHPMANHTYFSIGGGFVVEKGAEEATNTLKAPLPYAFETSETMLQQCKEHSLSVAELMRQNEYALFGQEETQNRLNEIWQAMDSCIKRGCDIEGYLPGGLEVKRRAHEIFKDLNKNPEKGLMDPLTVMDWVSLFALAVNEENAAGGRVVTSPTNGAAGVIPAVLAYYVRFVPGSNQKGIEDFLLTAGAIGTLYKHNASISAAEVGCQGEIGVACSMAAGALCQVLGGTPDQVENAAEIGMEHNLGMTCDPIGGLVQVPCIERNTMGAIKAINAARLALRGDGEHRVSLDSVINTMYETGKDMQAKYKETALGGLAVNVVLC